MAKIYVVTKGDYSDYHIVAATLDKEKAEKIKEKFDSKYEECEIEEYEDSETILKPMWRVIFEKDGALSRIDDESNSAYAYHDCKHNEIMKRNTGFMGKGDPYFDIYISADDEDHALKIARDKLAEYLAEKEGVKI